MKWDFLWIFEGIYDDFTRIKTTAGKIVTNSMHEKDKRNLR